MNSKTIRDWYLNISGTLSSGVSPMTAWHWGWRNLCGNLAECERSSWDFRMVDEFCLPGFFLLCLPGFSLEKVLFSPRTCGIEDRIFLGWHICRRKLARKIFFEARFFSRKMLRNFPRIFWAFLLWVRKNPAKFPSQNQKENHRRASAGAQGEHLCFFFSQLSTREHSLILILILSLSRSPSLSLSCLPLSYLGFSLSLCTDCLLGLGLVNVLVPSPSQLHALGFLGWGTPPMCVYRRSKCHFGCFCNCRISERFERTPFREIHPGKYME